jgi:hypothetical protein
MAYGANSTIGAILANPAAKAVLEKHVPGASVHPLLDKALGMTLREVTSYPEADLSAEKFHAIVADLVKIA